MTKEDLNFIRGNSEQLDFGKIPFNIPLLDTMLEGGIPEKHFTIISGMPSVGKTYLAYKIVESVINSTGKDVYWIDTENSYQRDWAEKCGVDTSKVQLLKATYAEKAYDAIRHAAKEKSPLVVLDSIAGLVPTAILDESFDYNPIGWLARSLSTNLPRLTSDITDSETTTFLAINQLRANPSPYAPDTLPGGRTQSFQAHLILEVRKGTIIKEAETSVGFEMTVRITKSKVGGVPNNSVMIPFKYAGGIDEIEITLMDAINKKIIEKKGAWYYYKEHVLHGKNGLRDFFAELPDIYEELKLELAA